jgi:energy-converting hydrogenase B subunit D
MTPLIFILLLLLVVVGTGMVLTRDPLEQAMVASIYGLLLSTLFLALQAPDVALSETVVGAVLFPLMIVLALAKVKGKGAQ